MCNGWFIEYVTNDKVKTARRFIQDWLVFPLLFFFFKEQNKLFILVFSYRSTIPVQYSPKDIAMSGLFLATIENGEKPMCQGPLGNDIQWIELFDSDITEERLIGKLLIIN